MIKRIITGLLLAGLGVSVVLSGGWLLFGFLWVCSLVISWEILWMNKVSRLPLLASLSGVLITGLFLYAFFDGSLFYARHQIGLSVSLVLFSLFILEFCFKKSFLKGDVGAFIRAVLTPSLSFPWIMVVRDLDWGVWYILFFFTSIWVLDSAALLWGRRFGKNPLTEISPKKTIEGSIGGAASAVLWGWIFSLLTAYFASFFEWSLSYPFSLLQITLISLFIGVIAQIGDLHESLMKRLSQVKDSSHILPGHGGFYDRGDSILFSMPFLYLILILL